MKLKEIIITILTSTTAIAAAPMDVTIQGESREKVTIERVAPEPDVPLKDVIPFSRLGQTDWILSEELDYVDNDKQIAMMDVHSPKTFKPSMIEFAKPPFFVQAYPPPPTPILVDKRPNAPPPASETETWAFIVVDQNNNLLKKVEGNTTPAEPIQWDGMRGEEFLLRTDEVYSSMLIIQETPETARTIVGEPVSLPALRYVKGTKIIFEFSNRRIYEEGTSSFSPVLRVLIDQLLNDLRKHQGMPFTVTLYDRNLDLSQKRVKTWKTTLEDGMLKPADTFDVKTSMPVDRGEITQVVLEINK